MKDLNMLRDELADKEADYFSNIQFPIQWVEHPKDFKQDINRARRVRCYDDHKWGFQKGFDAAIEHLEKQSENKLNQNRCNSGHETLPLKLWDCPECVRLKTEQLEAKLAVAVEALKDANDKCRSAASIASREGRDTSWSPFRERLNESLAFQFEALEKLGAK